MSVTLLAPWGLAAGVAVAAALVALHAITVGRPRPSWLPTARFAPERAPRAVRRLSRPRDRRLLALRVLVALLAGLALARPVRTPPRVAVTRLILADRSRAADANAVAASVRRLARPGDVVLPFDVAPGAPFAWPADVDSATWSRALDAALAVRGSGARDARGSLSAAMVAARRAAPALAAGADSLELAIVSPLARETMDAATLAVRAAWPGRARIVQTARAGNSLVPVRAPLSVAVREAPRDDALLAAFALAGIARVDSAPVRVTRARATDADRAWASAAGRVLVEWPADGAPTGARAATTDSAYALVVGDRAVVAPFTRATALDTTNARVIAWWADARPAAVERAQGDGCIRSIGVAVPQVGDVALGDAFRALLPALLAPCGAARDLAPLAPGDVARLVGRGPLLAAAPLRATPGGPRDRMGAALLAAAAALLLLELPLRRVLRRDDDAIEATTSDALTRAATSTREAA